MENPSIVAHQVARPLSIELPRYWVWNRSLLMPTQLLHTVIVDDCTGCDLCIDPCPVDCIDMVERPKAPDYWTPVHPKVISTDRFGQIEIQHG